MLADRIIVPVEEPTDWVNSLVVREKPNGSLRVCLDPRDLNKAIRREHYPAPRVIIFDHLQYPQRQVQILENVLWFKFLTRYFSEKNGPDF